ncbi:RHS repeat-associated core domain-containing protein [Thauera sp. WH-1]|uniref:RHS repeat-associated core domain-containing protein n=1 Tax=Thauera sp. WH-1 TaxID=3398230 RepID=UPI0039FD9529
MPSPPVTMRATLAPLLRRLLTLPLLVPLLLPAAGPDAALSAALAGVQTEGCGISMSCAPDEDSELAWDAVPPAPQQCVTNNAGDTCGAHGGPASQASATGQDIGAGNPLNLLSGNKYQHEADMPALPGVLGLELVRHYNSLRAHRGESRGLGAGWRLSYDTELQIRPDRLVVVQADGARVIFPRDPAQPQRCASTDPSRGEIRIRPRADGAEYVWHWPQGRRLSFDAAGRLVQIQAPTGEFLSLQRDHHGRLLEISDPQGRSLHLHYHPAGSAVTGIAHIDSPVGRFSYEQGFTGSSRAEAAGAQPGAARGAARNLLRVVYPAVDARSTAAQARAYREYHYEDARHGAALTGITLASTAADGTPRRERLTSYAYDDAGRGVRSVHGPMPAEDETGIEDVRLEFPARGRSILTNSLGQRTTYLSAVIGGQRRILEARGPGCARCGPTDVRYRYAPNGRLTAATTLDAEGRPRRSVQHRLDANGRIVETLEADLSARVPRLLDHVRYEYAADASAIDDAHTDGRPHAAATPRTHPTAIVRPSVVVGREHRIKLRYNEAGQLVELRESGFSPVDANGRLAATPIERSTRYRYARINGRSVLAEIDGPLENGPAQTPADSDITRLHWDARGSFVIALEQPGDRRAEIEPDPATGLPLRVRNDDGHETRWRHDSALNPVEWRSRGPGERSDRIHQAEYDALGHLIELRTGTVDGSPVRALWRRAYDTAGRLQWHADALGIARLFTHDSESRLIDATLRSASFARRRTWDYDGVGRLERIADNNGFQRALRYDGSGRLVSLTDSHGREQLRSAGRDAIGAGAAVPVRGPRTLHDDFGRPVWTHSPDHGETLRSFDAADRIKAMRDAVGHHARYAYDARGRIVQQSVTDARTGQTQTTRWRYDGARLLEVDHPTQRERFDYDAAGQRRARTVTLKAAPGELSTITRYEYDDRDRLSATTLPDGSRLHYVRNGQGQIVALHRQPVRTPWLRWLGREQIIAADFERDLFGLRSYRSGNGVRTRLQRSRNGTLQRVTHHLGKDTRTIRLTLPGASPMRPGQTLGQRIEELLGLRPAHAATLDTWAAEDALLDHRYVWDAEGNLLHQREGSRVHPSAPLQRSQAYDHRNQLVASVEWSETERGLQQRAMWRYAYDASQRRVLAQEGVDSQHELHAKVERTRFEPGTHRVLSRALENAESADGGYTPDAAATYNANGQPEREGAREYQWDALGRLAAVTEHGRPLARYTYDHRGLRITRSHIDATDGIARTTHTVYDDARQPLAELDADGTLTRQYLWLADLPLAVLDLPTRPVEEIGGLRRIIDDLGRAVQSWFAPHAGLAWLHTNHLNAPELATDGDGKPIWRARYAPFGAATITPSPARPGFTLALRLPGQIHDPETGLHYNRQRYYDPDRGQYLTPDPLGTPDGPNPYAYVAFNPLGFVDPDGLILFAFDGTGNTDNEAILAELGSGVSNVWEFRQLYADGNRRYVSGVGVRHFDDDHGDISLLWGNVSTLDMAGNFTGPERIDRMHRYFDDEAELFGEDDGAMDVDIIGFSRGAAQAREFANRIVGATTDGIYRYTININGKLIDRCQRINFRFMGLFDTVLSTNLSGSSYSLAVPEEFAYVAHAIALNEYRGSGIRLVPGAQGAFPLESILASPDGESTSSGHVRIERGFVGSHADIGGGFPGEHNQLAEVALRWMVEQAKTSGVRMIDQPASSVPAGAHLHDKSNNQHCPSGPECHPALAEDREVRYLNGDSTAQREMTSASGMTYSDTAAFITYLPPPPVDGPHVIASRPDDIVGTVDMHSYLAWLGAHGYTLGNLHID